MEHRPLIALLAMLSLSFFGCISIEYTHSLDRDGNSIVTETVDMSALLSAGGQYSGASEGLSDACANITKSDPAVNCTYGDGELTVSKALKLSENFYVFNKTSEFPYAVYHLEVRRVPPVVATDTISGTSSQAEYDFADPSAKLGASTMKAAGASFEYIIDMPGEIEKAENGEIIIDGSGRKRAKYDVLGLMQDGKYISVTSRELDMPLLLIIAAGAVLLIGGLAVAVVLMKAMKKK